MVRIIYVIAVDIDIDNVTCQSMNNWKPTGIYSLCCISMASAILVSC